MIFLDEEFVSFLNNKIVFNIWLVKMLRIKFGFKFCLIEKRLLM